MLLSRHMIQKINWKAPIFYFYYYYFKNKTKYQKNQNE